MTAILTDDLELSAEFLADEDIARDEDEYDSWHRGPKCGGREYENGDLVGGCAGCKHCDPVDCECKPHGFGIEKFEDPALLAANEQVAAESWQHGFGLYTSAFVSESWTTRGCLIGPPFDRAKRDFLWRYWSKLSDRRYRHSEVVWNRICDESETHREAKDRYEEWAKRAVTVRYRDE